MPKTNINDSVSEGWRTEVSWAPRKSAHATDGKICDQPDACGEAHYPLLGHVQVASVNQHSEFLLPGDLLDYSPDGEEIREDPEPFTGWRVTLDDVGIDRLIEALTTAKRQAFAS